MTLAPDAQPTVAVIGGGYGGTWVAKELEAHARVVLIEPKDAFHHNVAALRGLVDATSLARTFLPYDRLLTHGTVLRDRAVDVSAERVVLASGQQLRPDFLVLATGSTYPFPAKAKHSNHADAIAQYESLRAQLVRAQRIMLLGAGAVGIELAGEIASAWPDKQVVLVDQADQLLPGAYEPDLREALNRQLDDLGVLRVLGAPLTVAPATEPGDVEPFAVTTANGTSIEADLWLRCYGIAPVTDYLSGDLAAARATDGYLNVDTQLRVAGHETVYALGDIVSIDANRVGIARRQADVVAANIRAAIAGSDERTSYVSTPTNIILPFGPAGGAGSDPVRGVLSSAAVARLKGGDMLVNRYEEFFGMATPSA